MFVQVTTLVVSASAAQHREKLFHPCVAWPKGALLGLVAKMNVAESLLENQNPHGNIFYVFEFLQCGDKFNFVNISWCELYN